MESTFEESVCQLERYMSNPGLEHISRQIFESMDLETIKACRQVSKNWCDFIDSKTNYWQRFFPKIRKFLRDQGKYYHPKSRDRYRYKNSDSESDSDLDLDSDSEDDEFYECKFIKTWWNPFNKVIAHFEDTTDNEIRKGFVVMMLESIDSINNHYSSYTLPTPLHEAVKYGFYYLVKYCMDEKLFDFYYTWKNNPVLHIACQYGHKDIIELILKNVEKLEIELNIRKEIRHLGGYRTEFQILCQFGNEELIDMFIQLTKDKGIDYNIQDVNGCNLLHFSNAKVVGALMKYHQELGLDINATDKVGRTPLQQACVRGDHEKVKAIILAAKDHGLILDHSGPQHSQDTPLHVAVALLEEPTSSSKYAFKSTEVLEVLLKYAFEDLDFYALNLGHLFGETPLCKEGGISRYISFCDENDIALELEKKYFCEETILHKAAIYKSALNLLINYFDKRQQLIIFNVMDNNGDTPLHKAVYSKSDSVEILLNYCTLNELELDVQVKNLFGKTVFHYDSYEALKLLLNYCKANSIKLDANDQDNNGKTPLHYAVDRHKRIWRRDGESVQELLDFYNKNGIQFDFESKDIKGCTVLHHAGPESLKILSRFCKENGVKIDFNVQDNEGQTPLHFACNKRDWFIESLEAFIWLSKAHFIDFNAKDHNGRTPIFNACQIAGEKEIKFLLKQSISRGINFNVHDNNGQTVLHWLCQNGMNLTAIELLLKLSKKNPIDVNALDTSGKTPFHIACEHGQKEVVKIFLACFDNGVKFCISATDHNGMTPIHLACTNNFDKIVELFLDNPNRKFRRNIRLDARDKNGMTPLATAIANDNSKIIVLITKFEFTFTKVYKDVRNKQSL